MSEEPKEGEKEKLEETSAEEDTAQKPTEEDEKPQEAAEGGKQSIDKAKEQTGDGNGDEQIEGLHMLLLPHCPIFEFSIIQNIKEAILLL